MKRKSNSTFLHRNQRVQTDDGQQAFVIEYVGPSDVAIRYEDPFWPFPRFDVKQRCQLTPVEIEYEEAPF